VKSLQTVCCCAFRQCSTVRYLGVNESTSNCYCCTFSSVRYLGVLGFQERADRQPTTVLLPCLQRARQTLRSPGCLLVRLSGFHRQHIGNSPSTFSWQYVVMVHLQQLQARICLLVELSPSTFGTSPAATRCQHSPDTMQSSRAAHNSCEQMRTLLT
jgi:hypothetical protein